MKARIGTLVLLVLLVVLPDCGGGGTGVAVSISPPFANVIQGGTQSFTAKVTGSTNPAVNWTVQEGIGGSITSMGVYTAPNKGGTFHVIATSQADTSKSSTAIATVPPVAISLNQTAVTIDVGNQFTFVADVTGKTNTAVSWAIQEGSSGGSITSAGIYTAPATLGTFHVIATSQADNTRHATATVTVVTLELSVSPTSDVLGPQGVRVFSIAVNSSLNPNVTWSVQEGAAGGSITASGQYTAPKNTGLIPRGCHQCSGSDQECDCGRNDCAFWIPAYRRYECWPHGTHRHSLAKWKSVDGRRRPLPVRWFLLRELSAVLSGALRSWRRHIRSYRENVGDAGFPHGHPAQQRQGAGSGWT